MSNFRYCDQKVMWAELQLPNKVIQIQIDPKPNDKGDLRISPSHPDLPLRAQKITDSYDGPRYTAIDRLVANKSHTCQKSPTAPHGCANRKVTDAADIARAIRDSGCELGQLENKR